MSQDSKPVLTLVVVPIAGDSALLRCLQSVVDLPTQLIVVAAQAPVHPAVLDLLAERNIELLIQPELSVPQRRAAGIAASKCAWVAVLEDTCVVHASWMAAALELIRQGACAAATGPVVLAPSLTPAALALGCTEYGRFSLHALFGEAVAPIDPATRDVARTVGVNMLYQTASVKQHLGTQGLIESEVDPALVAAGGRIVAHRALQVELFCVADGATNLGTRYAHGRLYGGLLARRSSLGGRALHLAKCCALPVVLSWRAMQALPAGYAAKSAARGHILRFELAWSVGEFVGTLFGPGSTRRSWS